MHAPPNDQLLKFTTTYFQVVQVVYFGIFLKMISKDVEKYCIFVWSVLTTILSSVGNCTVLVATIKYDAIKLDNISKVTTNLKS